MQGARGLGHLRDVAPLIRRVVAVVVPGHSKRREDALDAAGVARDDAQILSEDLGLTQSDIGSLIDRGIAAVS